MSDRKRRYSMTAQMGHKKTAPRDTSHNIGVPFRGKGNTTEALHAAMNLPAKNHRSIKTDLNPEREAT